MQPHKPPTPHWQEIKRLLYETDLLGMCPTRSLQVGAWKSVVSRCVCCEEKKNFKKRKEAGDCLSIYALIYASKGSRLPGRERSVGFPILTRTRCGTTWPAHSYNPEYTLHIVLFGTSAKRYKTERFRIKIRVRTKDIEDDMRLRSIDPMIIPSQITTRNLCLSLY